MVPVMVGAFAFGGTRGIDNIECACAKRAMTRRKVISVRATDRRGIGVEAGRGDCPEKIWENRIR